MFLKLLWCIKIVNIKFSENFMDSRLLFLRVKPKFKIDFAKNLLSVEISVIFFFFLPHVYEKY